MKLFFNKVTYQIYLFIYGLKKIRKKEHKKKLCFRRNRKGFFTHSISFSTILSFQRIWFKDRFFIFLFFLILSISFNIHLCCLLKTFSWSRFSMIRFRWSINLRLFVNFRSFWVCSIHDFWWHTVFSDAGDTIFFQTQFGFGEISFVHRWSKLCRLIDQILCRKEYPGTKLAVLCFFSPVCIQVITWLTIYKQGSHNLIVCPAFGRDNVSMKYES